MPRRRRLRKVSAGGEPRRAMLLTGVIVLGALMLRNLNAIAPLISMFFLITYAVINVVMLVESSLGLVSFRPTLRLPRLVPLLGTAGCLFAMFIVNPTFSLVAVGAGGRPLLLDHAAQARAPGDDVRSGIFVAFAEWAASKVHRARHRAPRAPGSRASWCRWWTAPSFAASSGSCVDLCQPAGSVKLLGIADQKTVGRPHAARCEPRPSPAESGVFTTWRVIDSAGFTSPGTIAGPAGPRSAFFRPNVLFLTLPEGPERHAEHARASCTRRAPGDRSGAARPARQGRARPRRSVVNVWLRPPIAGEIGRPDARTRELNLGILLGYRLARGWEAELNLISVVRDESEAGAQPSSYVEELRDLCRIPADAPPRSCSSAPSKRRSSQAPQSDMDILGMPKSSTWSSSTGWSSRPARAACSPWTRAGRARSPDERRPDGKAVPPVQLLCAAFTLTERSIPVASNRIGTAAIPAIRVASPLRRPRDKKLRLRVVRGRPRHMVLVVGDERRANAVAKAIGAVLRDDIVTGSHGRTRWPSRSRAARWRSSSSAP